MFGFLSRKKVDPRAALKRVLGDFALPSFPGVVLEVMKEARSEDGSVSSVARIIANDPGMSVKLLRLVNSAAYGSARRTESVQLAVAMLGMAQTESLVLSVGVQGALPSSPSEGFESRRFWRAAARRATTAQAFAALLHPATKAQSFTASLLQDMAVPLLVKGRPREYGAVLEEWHAGGQSLEILERSQLDCDHGAVATWVCNEWGLPESIAEAIGGHHGASDLECPAAVHIVSAIRETDESPGLDELVELAQGRYDVRPDRSLAVVKDSFERAEELAVLFS